MNAINLVNLMEYFGCVSFVLFAFYVILGIITEGEAYKWNKDLTVERKYKFVDDLAYIVARSIQFCFLVFLFTGILVFSKNILF